MLEILESLNPQKYSDKIMHAVSDLKAVEAMNGKIIAGYALYSYQNDKVIILDFFAGDDIGLADALIRAIFLKASLKGIQYARFDISDSNRISILKKLSFINQDDKIPLFINDFMSKCEKCKKNN